LIFGFASCDLHDEHSVADYIGDTLLAFGASGHYVIPSTETNIDRQLEETSNGNIRGLQHGSQRRARQARCFGNGLEGRSIGIGRAALEGR
jgi:hypothetical protein